MFSDMRMKFKMLQSDLILKKPYHEYDDSRIDLARSHSGRLDTMNTHQNKIQ